MNEAQTALEAAIAALENEAKRLIGGNNQTAQCCLAVAGELSEKVKQIALMEKQLNPPKPAANAALSLR